MKIISIQRTQTRYGKTVEVSISKHDEPGDKRYEIQVPGATYYSRTESAARDKQDELMQQARNA